MKIGLKDYSQICKDYHEIDNTLCNGEQWLLFEDDLDGEDAPCIAVNLTKKYYVYTEESLRYTVDNLDEFEMYSL